MSAESERESQADAVGGGAEGQGQLRAFAGSGGFSEAMVSDAQAWYSRHHYHSSGNRSVYAHGNDAKRHENLFSVILAVRNYCDASEKQS